MEVNKVIGLCGFGGGYMTFDGERLKGNASCEVVVVCCVEL